MSDITTRAPRTKTPVAERFWKFVDQRGPDECWEWQGALRNGYGVLNIDKKVVYAHRFTYELHHGPLAERMHALHKCDNRKCVNPAHIFAGTKGDNARDMYAKGRGKGGGKKGKRIVWLTAENVVEIRKLAAQGIRYPALSQQFGVSISQISMIITRKRWGHVA